MFRLLIYTTLSLASLSTLVFADCSACASYDNAIKTCQTSSHIIQVGTTMDSNTIHCMCSSKSNVTAMNACQACCEADPSLTLLSTVSVLAAWAATCQADIQFGDKQAALCWQGQPDNYIPCVSKSDGHGGTGGSTNSSSTTRYVYLGFGDGSICLHCSVSLRPASQMRGGLFNLPHYFQLWLSGLVHYGFKSLSPSGHREYYPAAPEQGHPTDWSEHYRSQHHETSSTSNV